MAFADRFRSVQAAQAEFADRSDEVSAFDAAIAHNVSRIEGLNAGAWTVEDPATPRANVLTYYGVGGIGKTTLIGKLVDRLGAAQAQPSHWPPPITYTSPVVTCSLDMSDFEPEDALLALRAAVAGLAGGVKAFDLCLARYWSERHGNATIAEAFKRRGRLARIGSAIGIGEQIQTAMEDVGAAVLGTALPGLAAFRGMAHAGSAIWHRRLANTALRECPGLNDLLAEPANVTSLAYYGYALAWDLAQLQKASGARLVVFIDTFEEAGPGGSEFINRLAWMLPNALFVIAGRNALKWAEPGSDLEFTGADRWPTLVAGAESDPRQHLVGFLSMEDRLGWLRQSLAAHCSDDVIELAAHESQGLPVHLDLIAQHVLEVATSREVTLDDVGGNLDVIARRVLRDLSDAQRRAALASSLYRWFDVELLRVTADLPSGGAVAELTARPYVEKLQRLPYSYRLHDLLRDAFRSAKELGDDQWLAADWERAAHRGAELLRDRLETSAAPADYQEHAELLFTLVATFGFDFNWLTDVAVRMTSWSVWNVQWNAEPLRGLHPTQSWSTALAEGLAVVMRRQVRSRATVAQQLETIVSKHPTDSRLDVLRYFLGQAQRDAGLHAASAITLTGLLGGVMEGDALKGLTHLHRRTGDFAAAQALVRDNANTITHAARLSAEIGWTEGRLEESAGLFRESAAAAGEAQDRGEQALCLASAAWCNALLGNGPFARGLIEDARSVLRSSYQSFADVLAAIAEAFLDARANGTLDGLADAEAYAGRVGQTSLVAYARFARCLALLGQHQGDEFAPALATLTESIDGLSFAYLEAIVRHVARLDQQTAWHDETVLARWESVVAAWGQEVG